MCIYIARKMKTFILRNADSRLELMQDEDNDQRYQGINWTYHHVMLNMQKFDVFFLFKLIINTNAFWLNG